MNELIVKASELKRGDLVRKSRRHKVRKVMEVILLTDKDLVPEHWKGRLLIIWSTCKQSIAKPDEEVITVQPAIV